MLSIQAAEEKALIVEQQNGSTTVFLLSEKPEMTFADHVLQIGVNGKTTSFEIEKVQQFYFKNISSGVSPLAANGLRIYSPSDDKIVIEGIDEKDAVSLYTIEGVAYANCVSTQNRTAEVSLASLPKGTYLINISNKKTFKIVRK